MFADISALHVQQQQLWHSVWPGAIITNVSDNGNSDTTYSINAAMTSGSW